MNRGGPGQTPQNKPHRPKGSTVSTIQTNITLPRAPPPPPPPRTFRPQPPLSRLPVTSLANHAAQRARTANLLARYTGIDEGDEYLSVGGTKLCPVCGSENPADATRCSKCTTDFVTTPAPVPLNQAAFNAETKRRGEVYAKIRNLIRRRANTRLQNRTENSAGNGGIQVPAPIPDGMKECPLCLSLNPKSATKCSACGFELTSGGGKSRKSRKNRSKSRKSRKNRRRH